MMIPDSCPSIPSNRKNGFPDSSVDGGGAARPHHLGREGDGGGRGAGGDGLRLLPPHPTHLLRVGVGGRDARQAAR